MLYILGHYQGMSIDYTLHIERKKLVQRKAIIANYAKLIAKHLIDLGCA